MPIKPENRARYPKDWPMIRERILERAGHCCEWCGVPNYAVGYRAADGRFEPIAGSGPADAAGRGLQWPSLERIGYADAAEFAKHENEWSRSDGDGRKCIVIVLTTAHLHDMRPEACGDDNLAALCQRCHNRHDIGHRRETRLAAACALAPMLFARDGVEDE